MATGRITKRTVEAIPLPPGSSRSYLWDESLKGFGVMVTPAGARSYLVQYRIGGRGQPTRRYTIGRHGSPWTADKARERAADLLEMVRKKVDPLEADRTKLSEAAETKKAAERFAFGAYADLFIRLHVDKRKLRSADDIKAVFRRDLRPCFGDKPINSIKKADVQACLDAVMERSGSAANKAHKWLRKMFAVAEDRGDLAASPMKGMGQPHEEGKRKRVLKAAEIPVIWRAVEKLGEPWASFVHLKQLLGQRLREVGGMEWEELDLGAATWIIPGARTKNKRDHLVHLPPQAVAILAAIQPDPKKRKGYVFSTNGGRSPISGFSKMKAKLDGLVKDEAERVGLDEPVAPWVFHDLRRTMATGLQGLGFPKEHVSAVLNHVSGGRKDALNEIYQLHDYKEEKAAALNAWGRYLDALLSGRDGSNVVPLATARA